MNKHEIISFPNNVDMTNPYKLNNLSTAGGITKVTYSTGMELTQGQWTWDTDELAYWIFPKSTTGTVGYVKLIDENIDIQAGDEIEAEFEVKCIGTPATNQRVGVRTDLLNGSLGYLASLDFFTNEFKNEYQTIKLKKIVNPSLISVQKMAFIFGVLTSGLSEGYSIKIRQIKVSIIRNSAYLTPNPVTYKTYGLGLSNYSIANLTDNINTQPTSGARDITLKSGVYGFMGGGAANESLSAGGVLIVLPYRADGVGGNNYIEQIAIINSVDPDAGMWRRGYNGATQTWSKWQRVNRYVSVPASATATGQVGDAAADANYLYICHAKDTWKRVALSTW